MGPRTKAGAAVFLLLLAGFALVLAQGQARRRGAFSPPETGFWLVLRPLQRAFTGTGHWLGDVGRVMFRRGGLLEEKAGLERRVLDLEGQNRRLLRYRAENDELRRLLALPRPAAGQPVAAEVVGWDASAFSDRLFLNSGTRRGVRPKDVVYTAQGVAGQIVRADALTSEVLLITDRQAAVGAMTLRTRARGLLRGTGRTLCRMEYLDYFADVKPGDLVLTAGDSEIFPRGLVLGRVVRVQKDRYYSRTAAEVEPAVPFTTLSTVLVRTGAGATTAAAAALPAGGRR